MKKLMLLAAAGAGYVLGARAGRERYDQIRGTFEKVKNDPRVQEKTQQAVDMARQQAPTVADKVTSAASSTVGAAGRLRGHDDSEPNGTAPFGQGSPTAGPQGDLP